MRTTKRCCRWQCTFAAVPRIEAWRSSAERGRCRAVASRSGPWNQRASEPTILAWHSASFAEKKLFPGVSLNLSKSGASLSFGPRGAKVTVGPKGVRKTGGVPGTGAYWTEHSGYGQQSRRSNDSGPPAPTARPEDQLSFGFFDRLTTPQNEEDFVDGLRQYVQGNEEAAFRHFQKAPDLADAAFMAGLLALKQERRSHAERFLNAAKSQQSRLGRYFRKYGIQAAASLKITERVSAIIEPDVRGLLLTLAEVHQNQGRPKEAMAQLRTLYRQDPEDVVVRLSLAELLLEEGGTQRNCKTVVRLAEDVENQSEIHTGLLLYKAKALRKLGLPTAARETLSTALRRKKDRSGELIRALRYERALAYQELGWEKRYRKALEKLYAESPDYEDVQQRLGVA